MVVRENPPHAIHVQFAEAEHFRFAFNDQPGGADGICQIRIAFLNDDTALHAADELGDFF